METWEAIRSRRNVRSFTDQPIPADHLDEILEAGRRAPSSRNWQPWDFVVVTERPRLVELSAVQHGGGGHVASAAAAVAVCAPVISVTDDERQFRNLYYDLGQATMSMLLAAAGLRIGSGHAGVADQLLARKVLGLPENRFCAYVLSFGYPADRALTLVRYPDRRDLTDVVHRDHW